MALAQILGSGAAACREEESDSESELEDEEPGVRHGEDYQVRGVPLVKALRLWVTDRSFWAGGPGMKALSLSH